ncbi:MAG: hypothetical protein H6811_07990 [Phycisphaeraceae bacterium]|nr:hypothetical protein [Phycisphaeraceae bacterium]
MRLTSLAVIGVCGAAGNALAQSSPLYMIAYDTNEAVIVRNGVLVTAWNNSGPSRESALAIDSTVRVLGRNPSQNGQEYDLGGSPIGGPQYPNPGFTDVYDATTDGTFNYGVAHNDTASGFAVVRGGTDWSGVSVHFVPAARCSGIAFDSSTNTLWLAKNFGGFQGLMQYDLAGTLLQDISTPYIGGAGYGLAYDAADDTFWITGAFNGGVVDCYQLDKLGNVLQTVDLPAYNTHWISAEFAADPGCPADIDHDGDVDGDDFFEYLDLFAAGDDAADLDGDGDRDADDFFMYLDLFAQGC